MKTMERFLIKQDDKLYESIASDFRSYSRALYEMKAAYDLLGLGDLTTEIYRNALHSQENVLKMYNGKLNQQLDDSGIHFQKLRDNILEGSEELYEKFQLTMRNVHDSHNRINHRDGQYQLSLNEISIRNNQFQVSEEDKEEILEKHCRVYLYGDDELELYECINRVMVFFNNLKAVCVDLKIDKELPSFGVMMKRFFKEVDGSLKLNEFAIRRILDCRTEIASKKKHSNPTASDK